MTPMPIPRARDLMHGDVAVVAPDMRRDLHEVANLRFVTCP